MKIIALNTWGGRGGKEKLLSFFDQNQNVDVFCLQEVWNGGDHMKGSFAAGVPRADVNTQLLEDVRSKLPNHIVHFRPNYFDWYGLAIFVNKKYKILEEGEMYIYKEKGYIHHEDLGNHARTIQWVTLELGSSKLSIINIHALWNGKGKGDSEDRLLQSERIVTFLKTIKNPYIICGDFNLTPTTESIKKLEDFGLRNLIKEFGVTSTRTSMYTKVEKFADYAFLSPGIKLEEFKVLPDEVSDHAPLYLHIREIK